MRKHLLSISVLLAASVLTFTACSKDDDDPGNDTRADLLARSSWKFEKAESSGFDVSDFIDDCIQDNTLTFVATSDTEGTGTADEGATKCDQSDPQSAPFTWELRSNGTVLYSSQAIIDEDLHEFNIVSISDTRLVLSQTMTSGPFEGAEVTITLTH